MDDIPVRGNRYVCCTGFIQLKIEVYMDGWIEATGYRIRILNRPQKNHDSHCTGALSTLDRSDRQGKKKFFFFHHRYWWWQYKKLAYTDASGEYKSCFGTIWEGVRLTERYLGNVPARDQHFIEAQKKKHTGSFCGESGERNCT